jgi:hypothetical protein
MIRTSVLGSGSPHHVIQIPSLEKKPIKAIAKREITRNGQLKTEYLVLWCSWESLN